MLPRTLFARTVAVIASVSVVYLLFAASVIGYFMLVPVGRLAADDLAALMEFSADSWVKVPADERSRFEDDLLKRYNLKIVPLQPMETARYKPLPYYYFLEQSLSRRIGHEVRLKISQDSKGIDWYWADLEVNGKPVRIGFSSTHIDARPPLVLVLLLIVGGLATLVTGSVLVRHITTPLETLSRNARRIGSGDEPERIPETGPEEMRNLARSFNQMAAQVKELLTNRTTLLAGISHDLRTPLARMQLSLEMMPEDSDRSLLDGMKADLEQMNCLIGQFLELSKTLEKGERQDINLVATIDELVACGRRGGAVIEWQPSDECTVVNNPMAVRRIIINLLENAVRYGGGRPVEISCLCEQGAARVSIKDRGPGIPEEELEAVFRPFYRLERSRNTETGGTGLGLSIALQLAELNGIEIKLFARDGGGMVAEVRIQRS